MTHVKILHPKHANYGELVFFDDKPAEEMIALGFAKPVEFTLADFDAFIDKLTGGNRESLVNLAVAITKDVVTMMGYDKRDADEFGARLKRKMMSDDEPVYPDADDWKNGVHPG